MKSFPKIPVSNEEMIKKLFFEHNEFISNPVTKNQQRHQSVQEVIYSFLNNIYLFKLTPM